MSEHREYGYDEIVEMAAPLVESGAEVHFKWTCENCGERPLFQEPNTIYHAGECCECGHVTDPIRSYGLMVAFTIGKRDMTRRSINVN